MRRPKRLPLALAFVGWAATTLASLAAPVVGNTTLVKPGVFRNSAGTTVSLGQGAPVEAEDLLNTDREGRAKLRFLDGSMLDIGPGSEVRIDKFVYDPRRSAAGATIALSKGVLRFVSNKAPDGSYQFRTPTTTLGIRGTGFGMAFNPATGVTTIQVSQGAVQVCANTCVTLQPGGGNTATVDSNGNVSVSNQAPLTGDQTITFGINAGVLGPDGTSVLADVGTGIGTGNQAIILGGAITVIAVPAALVAVLSDDSSSPPPPISP